MRDPRGLTREVTPALAAREQDKSGTAAQILDVAELVVQVRGFSAFSYADIARELKISTAAVHYHFAGKAELGEALIARYAARFAQDLAAVGTRFTLAPGRLDGFVGLHVAVLLQRRMCLCGVLAAEYQTLPPSMQTAVIGFFDQSEAWLQGVLERGQEEGSLQLAGSAREAAQMIVSGIEGAMLVAAPYGDTGHFQAAAASLLAGLAGGKTEPARWPNPPDARPGRSREASHDRA